jgi:hypothetical protein
MDGLVKEMIAEHMKLAEMIIKDKGKKGDKTAGVKPPVVKQVMDASDGKIIDDIKLVIEVEGTIKGVRIDNESQAADEHDGTALDSQRPQMELPLGQRFI